MNTPAQVHAALAARLSPNDLPGSWSQREREDYIAYTSLLDGNSRTIRTSEATLADLEPQIAQYTKWQQQLGEWRQTLANKYVALQPRDLHQFVHRWCFRAIEDGFEPGTGFSLETSPLGALMRAAGYVETPPTEGRVHGRLPWYGSLPEVELRLKELRQREADARARLQDALLDDDERAQRDAANKERAAALNARPREQQKLRGYAPDGSLPPVAV